MLVLLFVLVLLVPAALSSLATVASAHAHELLPCHRAILVGIGAGDDASHSLRKIRGPEFPVFVGVVFHQPIHHLVTPGPGSPVALTPPGRTKFVHREFAVLVRVERSQSPRRLVDLPRGDLAIAVDIKRRHERHPRHPAAPLAAARRLGQSNPTHQQRDDYERRQGSER